MPIIKKIGTYKNETIVPNPISSEMALLALKIFRLEYSYRISEKSNVSGIMQGYTQKLELIKKFSLQYLYDEWRTTAELIMSQALEGNSAMSEYFSLMRSYSDEAIYNNYAEQIKSQKAIEPEKKVHKTLGDMWYYKGNIYKIDGTYTDEQSRLLILEEEDKQRRLFEKLNLKFNNSSNEDSSYSRPRIPENVRVEVWRRDGGKCARCGSREKLEYDHIVPISKGGSNTARNIELLCEKCNRSKHNNVV
jgi:hypothetical protein